MLVDMRQIENERREKNIVKDTAKTSGINFHFDIVLMWIL